MQGLYDPGPQAGAATQVMVLLGGCARFGHAGQPRTTGGRPTAGRGLRIGNLCTVCAASLLVECVGSVAAFKPQCWGHSSLTQPRRPFVVCAWKREVQAENVRT